MWNEIINKKDIDKLMEEYGSFHDSCIISVNYQSGYSVDDELSMHFSDSKDHILSIVFKRQYKPITLEMQFIGLRQCNLIGWQENYLNDIYDAHLSFIRKSMDGKVNKLILWADYEEFDINDKDRETCTYVLADSARWRFID